MAYLNWFKPAIGQLFIWLSDGPDHLRAGRFHVSLFWYLRPSFRMQAYVQFQFQFRHQAVLRFRRCVVFSDVGHCRVDFFRFRLPLARITNR
jgi:hypothetical protein